MAKRGGLPDLGVVSGLLALYSRTVAIKLLETGVLTVAGVEAA
jgi:hypothetical protein